MTKKDAYKEIISLLDRIESLAKEHNLSVVTSALDPKGVNSNNMIVGKGEVVVDMLYTLVTSHEDIRAIILEALLADKEARDNSDINLN